MAMTPEEPDDIDLLLPLHAAGLLGRAERDRVEAALARDAGKGRALARMRLEREAVIEANEAIPAPRAALSRLMAEVDAAVPVAPRVSTARPLGQRLSAALGDFLQPAFAFRFAALLAAALLGGILTYGTLFRDAGYRVATGERTLQGPTAIVGFVGEAKASAIQDALRQAHAVIVAGPKGDNFFEIRFREQEGLAPVEDRIRQFAARKDIVRHLNRAGQ
jgi:hypothetical protein